jgi:hypothetical protein
VDIPPAGNLFQANKKGPIGGTLLFPPISPLNVEVTGLSPEKPVRDTL